MRLTANPTLSGESPDLMRLIGKIAQQVNGLSEGQQSAYHSAATAAPTTGTFAQGDVVKNSAPAEAGGAGSKYVILGYLCVASGTPGTWVELRALTGN